MKVNLMPNKEIQNNKSLPYLIENRKIGNTGKTLKEFMDLHPEKLPEQLDLEVERVAFDKELDSMV